LFSVLQKSYFYDYCQRIVYSGQKQKSVSQDERVLTVDDEKRAVMYAGGFVVRKAKQYVENSSTIKSSGGCYDALDAMLVGGPWDDTKDTDFTNYVKQWIDKVDRGGITILSEGGYDFFLSLELQTYESIRQLQQTVKRMNVESVVERTLDK
jgi:hypothetical protein